MDKAPQGEAGFEDGKERALKAPARDFYDLMKFRIGKVLLVSSLYDAFTLEEDGLSFDHVQGDELALSAPPRVNRVSTGEEALEELKRSRYDLVITMSRLGDLNPYEFGGMVKELQPSLPVVLLLTDPGDIKVYHRPGKKGPIDRVFFWNGDPSLFLAITRSIEDMNNVVEDTRTGNVRVIMIVEDSPRYYSLFLPQIYSEVMRQNSLLFTEGLTESEKLVSKRARPKILLAETYEEALEKYKTFRESILCVITDVTYSKDGAEDPEAGFKLFNEISPSVPFLMQSSLKDHEAKARDMGIPFIFKGSESLLSDLSDFFKDRLGFGDFVFRMTDGSEIARARDLQEFIAVVQDLPAESLFYHGNANQFSNWLMARGEVELAAKLRPRKVSDFRNGEEMRKDLLDAIREMRRAKRVGVIIDFSQQDFEFDGTFTRLGAGSLGGKGRGLAFLSTLVGKMGVRGRVDGCSISIPDTLVLATGIFDRFMEQNGLWSALEDVPEDRRVMELFLKAKLPKDVRKDLERFMERVRYPLAVRSSSLLEDSQNQPFAGIYSTIMIPNNDPRKDVRTDQLGKAIKLVYASAFFGAARSYRRTTVHVSEEERMAVIVQRLVGNRVGGSFYPMFSGLAQSINYYPVEPLRREDGVVTVALGLGKLVMEREKVLSFSPRRPDVVPGLFTPEDALRHSQREFYALDMTNEDPDFMKGDESTLVLRDIAEAMNGPFTDYLTSTYDPNDNILRDGASHPGPKLVTFSGVLKHRMVPLARIVSELLESGRKGLGRPVEIEFACSLDPDGAPHFYPLQVRPLISMREKGSVSITFEDQTNALVASDKALGNGVIEGIRDIVIIFPEDFDNTMTVDITHDIGRINSSLNGAPYVLIGPGRWGTMDRFLGIPVKWDQISSVKAMVEYSTEGFQSDPSQGTHFFHNITALGIPYFTVRHNTKGSGMDWGRLRLLEAVQKTGRVTHLRAPTGLTLKVDGGSGRGLIKLN